MRPINYDYRAEKARTHFRVRALPLAYTVARYGVALYVAQAVAGFAVGFTLPWLRLMGVL